MIEFIKNMEGKDWFIVVMAVISTLSLFGKFFEDVFGIKAFGKKIYKGAPLLWTWWMQDRIFRDEMREAMDKLHADMKEIKSEVKTNGGSSIKDSVLRIEQGQRVIKQSQDYTNARMNINDMCSERMCFRTNDKGECIFINDSFLKQFGYMEHDVLGFAFESVVEQDHVMEMRTKWQRAIDSRSIFYDHQRIYKRGGEAFICEVKAYPILDGTLLKEFFGTIDIIGKLEPKTKQHE